MSARAFHLDLLGDPLPREAARPHEIAAQIRRQGGEFSISLGPEGARVRLGSIQEATGLARERSWQIGRRYCVYAALAGQKRPTWHLAATIDPGQPIDLTMLGSLLS